MTRKRKGDLLGLRFKVPRWSTRDVIEVLGVAASRLQNFLLSNVYGLSPALQTGTGRGSRRLYSREDIYRLKVASTLFSDGFRPETVAKVLGIIEDGHFLDWDSQGNERTPGRIVFRRTSQGPQPEHLFFDKAPARRPNEPTYYTLDLAEVVEQVDREIAALEKRRQKTDQWRQKK